MYVAGDLEMLFSCLTFVARHRPFVGAPEHTHRLRNCDPLRTNGSSKEFWSQNELPRKLALVSCIELPKQTSFRPDFVGNDVISSSFFDFV